jgi:YggT family protein
MQSFTIIETTLGLISSLVTMIFILRSMLQWSHISYLNPIQATLYKVTQPAVKVLLKISPWNIGRNWPVLICTYIIALILQSLLLYLLPVPFSIIKAVLLTILFCADQVLNIIFFATIISVIASWLKPDRHNPVMQIIYVLTERFLNKIRKLMPQTGRIDFSPILLILIIKAIQMFVITFLSAHIWELSI